MMGASARIALRFAMASVSTLASPLATLYMVVRFRLISEGAPVCRLWAHILRNEMGHPQDRAFYTPKR